MCNHSCPWGGLIFPDFVANSCCNPCCPAGVLATRDEEDDTSRCCKICICGCGNIGGVSDDNCRRCCNGNVGGVSDDNCRKYCNGNVGGDTDDRRRKCGCRRR